MKKNLFLAAVAATALAGCSSDDHLTNEPLNVVDNDLVPVEMGLTRNSVSVFQTRGTGTVGDIDAATNLYQNEDLYVLMTTVGGNPWGFTTVGEGANSLGAQFDGSFKSRPAETPIDVDGEKQWVIDYETFTGGMKKYYPTNGSFSDFFAFYVDDAAVDDAGEPVAAPVIQHATDVDSMTVRFKIDGTQDLLAGKAEKDDADVQKQVAAGIAADQRGYSSKTARKEIIPVIPMKHLLTRLTFGLTPGHQNAVGLIIDSIKIVSPNEGLITVAYDREETIEPSNLIQWLVDDENAEKTDSFRLKVIDESIDRVDATTGDKSKLIDVEPLAEIKAEQAVLDTESGTYTFTEQKVGDAFFVRPNQKQFPIRIFYRFPYETGAGTDYLNIADDFYVRLSTADALLEVGKSYHVNFTVYGLSEIEIRTTLEAWEDGGTIELDTAEPINTQENLDDEEGGDGNENQEP